MQNIAPSNLLTRRSRDLLYVALLIVLVGALLAVIGGAMFLISFVVPSNPNYNLYHIVRTVILVVGVLVILLGLVLVVRALTWKTDNRLAEQVGNELAQYVDGRFTFIRNINKLSVGYIDAVLVGPSGVLVFRITDKQGVLFNDGAAWLRQRDKGDWSTIRWNPTREVVDDIKKLREYLATRGKPDVPVFGVIVFTRESPDVQFTTQNPVVPVIYLSEISYNLSDSYFAKDRIDEPLVTELVNLLYAR